MKLRLVKQQLGILYSPKAPERIKHYIPDVKLIIILRNPVDRAYSAFLCILLGMVANR